MDGEDPEPRYRIELRSPGHAPRILSIAADVPSGVRLVHELLPRLRKTRERGTVVLVNTVVGYDVLRREIAAP